MNKYLVTIALGASIISTGAVAQNEGGGRGGWTQDQTRQQAQQRADMLFQMLDANKDGTVTKAEAEQAMAQMQAARGGDDNGGRGAGRMQRMIDQAFGASQALTVQQFETQTLARFDAMDLNHDGTVTAAERQQARAAQRSAGSAPAQ